MSWRWDELRKFIESRGHEPEHMNRPVQDELDTIAEKMTELEDRCDYCGADISNRRCHCENDE